MSAPTLQHLVCACGYEAYAKDPPEACPSCGQPLTVEEWHPDTHDPRGRRRDKSPGLVWTECLGCKRTLISDEDHVSRYCPACRSKELSLEGLDPWGGRTGGSAPDG